MPATNDLPVSADASRYACACCGRRISLDDLATSLLMDDGSGSRRLYHTGCWLARRLDDQPRRSPYRRSPLASQR